MSFVAVRALRGALVLVLSTSAGCAASYARLSLESGQQAPSGSVAPPKSPASAPPAIALGISRGRLVGMPLDSGLGWSSSERTTEAALLADQLALSVTERELSARAAPTGGPFWQAPRPRGTLAAAGDDGRWTALELRDPQRGESRVVFYDRRGEQTLHVESREGLASPAFAGGHLYLPWGDGYVSVIDARAARELARWQLPLRAQQALFDAGGTLFCASGLGYFALEGDAPQAFALPIRALPGDPLDVSAFDSEPLLARTDARAPSPAPRLYADPNRVRRADGHYLYVRGRIVLGLHLGRASVDWVHTPRSPVLGAAALADGFVLCDRTGTLTVLGDDGTLRDRIQLSTSVLSACAVRPGRLRTPPKAATAPPPAISQLTAALTLDDAELVDVQRFLLRELAARPEAEATLVLLNIASRPTALVSLQRDAGDLLALRRNGAEAMLEALSGGAAGPTLIPALADALAALEDKRAAPLLARQLNDPAHGSDALAHIAAALEKLAGPAQYDAVRVFFLLRRATADDAPAVRAVLSAARTLLRIGGSDGRGVVQLAADDPLTVAEVRVELLPLLARAAEADGAEP